jgi:hypothetical protein
MDTLTISGKKEKVNFLISKDLIEKSKWAAKELNYTLSDFFRIALFNFLKDLERARIEKELEEGYKANAKYYAQMSEEWNFADTL